MEITNTNEVWKEIDGYEGLYEVSNFGRVKNKTGLIMKQRFDKYGYKRISLTRREVDGKSSCKTFTIHRLVASAFIDNPENLECVNHRSENKIDNHVDNLEWCSRAHNNNFGSRENVCVGYGKPRPVINLDTGEVFESMGKAGKTYGVTAGSIYNACVGLSKTSCGCEWMFMDEYIELQEQRSEVA